MRPVGWTPLLLALAGATLPSQPIDHLEESEEYRRRRLREAEAAADRASGRAHMGPAAVAEEGVRAHQAPPDGAAWSSRSAPALLSPGPGRADVKAKARRKAQRNARRSQRGRS